jgi:hypothetical protein
MDMKLGFNKKRKEQDKSCLKEDLKSGKGRSRSGSKINDYRPLSENN